MASSGQEYRIPVLEAFPWQEQVLDIKVVYPPEVSSKGDRYVVPKNIPSNSSWYRHKNSIAWFDGTNWHYDVPQAGWVVYVESENEFYRFNGVDWVVNIPRFSSLEEANVVYVRPYPGDFEDATFNGSMMYPYPTITHAIEHIIEKNDNVIGNPYTIVLFPGIYEDNIRLNHSKLCSLSFVAWSPEGTFLKPRCDHSILSNEFNNCLQNLHFSNIKFAAPVRLEGHFDYTAFCTNLSFDNCTFEEGADIELINLNTAFFNNSCFEKANVYLRNVANFRVRGGVECDFYGAESLTSEKTFVVEADSHINQKVPMQWGDDKLCEIYLENCIIKRNIEMDLQNDSKCHVHVRLGAVLGRSDEDDVIIPPSADYIVINGALKGNYTYRGSLKLVNGFVTGTLISDGGVFDCSGQPISQIYNDTEIPGATLSDVLNGISGSISELETLVGDVLIYDKTLREVLVTPVREII